MTQIYECHKDERVDYYAIVPDGKRFRMRFVTRNDDGTFQFRGFFYGSATKKMLCHNMECVYDSVYEVV